MSFQVLCRFPFKPPRPGAASRGPAGWRQDGSPRRPSGICREKCQNKILPELSRRQKTREPQGKDADNPDSAPARASRPAGRREKTLRTTRSSARGSRLPAKELAWREKRVSFLQAAPTRAPRRRRRHRGRTSICDKAGTCSPRSRAAPAPRGRRAARRTSCRTRPRCRRFPAIDRPN